MPHHQASSDMIFAIRVSIGQYLKACCKSCSLFLCFWTKRKMLQPLVSAFLRVLLSAWMGLDNSEIRPPLMKNFRLAMALVKK